MRIAARLAVFVLSVLLAGCVTVVTREKFDDAQRATAEKQISPGKGTIVGEAFFRWYTGRVYTAGGEWIYLIPATAYAEERFRNLYGNQKFVSSSLRRLDQPDPEYQRLIRQVKANMRSKFDFENVSPGRYFVTTYVYFSNRDISFGFHIYDEVTVKGDEKVEVILSGN